MKVKELIKALKGMPKDANVYHLWDGRPRTAIECVWEAVNGAVITSDYSKNCYEENAYPVNPEWFWHEDRTISDPNGLEGYRKYSEDWGW